MNVDALEAMLNNLSLYEGHDQGNETNNEEPQEEEDPQPMDIQELVSKQLSQVLNSILTPQQKMSLQNNKCFNYSEAGHFACNCQKPKKHSLLQPQAAKTVSYKPSSNFKKFSSNKPPYWQNPFTKINEAVQELDDKEDIAELYSQHVEQDNPISQSIADFASNN